MNHFTLLTLLFQLKDFEKTYTGETKRKFETRREHQKAVVHFRVHLETKKPCLEEHRAKTNSYPVVFRRRAKDCGEDGGKEATGTFQFQNGGQYGG